jgi:bacteriocin biosynthesis cyclodehydratase domain-containing protein
MIRIPAFKAHLRPLVIPDEGVLLLSEDGASALYGTLYQQVVPLIDGKRSADDIAETLSGEMDAARVYYALILLEKDGYIAESVPEMEAEWAGFWHGIGLDPAKAEAALRTSKVRVLAIGKMDPEPLLVALADLKITTTTNEEKSALDLVLTDDYMRDELQDIAAAARAAGRRWMLLRPVGFEVWIGPLFVPEETGCLNCLRHKLTRHRLIQRFAAARGSNTELPLPRLQGSVRAACELVAIEAAKAIAGATNGLTGKVLSLDTCTWASRTHDLTRNPTCPVCGNPPSRVAVPMRLASTKVTFVEDGGHRTIPPEATLRKYEHLVSPITGIVNILKYAPSADGPVHVYMAGHNTAFRLDRLEDLKRGLRNASTGKGASETQARASALCEALERYSGEADGSEIRIPGSLREMHAQYGEAVIHPNTIMRYSDRQYAERAAWNAHKSRFNRVPEPFDDDVRVDWTPIWSLTEERHKYLPTQLVYFMAKASEDCDTIYCMGCSNGNASGNTREEAVLQGFLELVERDATALWWYNRLKKPGVDIASFGEPWFMDLAVHYDSLGRNLWALDITSDLGIPAFAAFSALRQGPEERILFGLGCHLDARIALQRALAEMNQMLGIAQACRESDTMVIEDEETLSWLKTATRANQPYIVSDAGMEPHTRSHYPVLSSGDLLQDISECRRRVEERGMEVLALDQTRPDIAMPVVKVIVPGLRHFWARYAPGRLYDVPVAMGWLDKPLAEDELNPIPIFF